MVSERTVGQVAWWGAVVATAVAPVHALARYATDDGSSDLDSGVVRAWAEPAARWLRPLLDWSGADTVYVTWGKAWFPLFLAATLCAFLVRRDRLAAATGAERWGWRLVTVGYALATASTFGDYWTPWLDESFLFLGIPGILISVIGSTVLGIGLLRRGYHPAATGWLLATWFPLFLLLSGVVAMGAAALPMLWAWAITGRRLAAGTESSPVAVAATVS